MSLEERIILLLTSDNIENIHFGATLLSSIGDEEKELEIFKKCCNADVMTYEEGSSFLSDRKILLERGTATSTSKPPIKTKNWTISIHFDTVFMMKPGMI